MPLTVWTRERPGRITRPGLPFPLGDGGRRRLSPRRRPTANDRRRSSCQGSGIVLKTPHGVCAPAPLMLFVPLTPGM